MADEDARWNWDDQRGVTWAAGLAAVALIALLVWAVVRTATSSHVPGFVPTEAPAVTTSAIRKTVSSTSTTSYPVPSVQTSQGTGLPPLPPPEPTVDVPTADEPAPSTSAPTTIFNPYATTTPPNGDAV